MLLVEEVLQDTVFRHFKASGLLDLAASLLSLTMISNDFKDDFFIEWNDLHHFLSTPEDPDNSVIDRQFPSPSSSDTVKLPQSFTADHLEQIAGIQIRWTDNLAHHLLLRDDDTTLMLYHHVFALLHHEWYGKILPKGLAKETMRTISLLLPPTRGKPNPWFLEEQKRHHLDPEAGMCEWLNNSERQIDTFHYWRDRLVLLKRTYDEAEPNNLARLWYDDRRKTQWFTFWVAVLVFFMTVFFGVIQSVASIIQAWAAVKSLKAYNDR